VAQYATACNIFNTPELPHKLDILRGHCETLGRPYDDIEKTVGYNLDVGERGERVAQIIDDLGQLAEMGFSIAHGSAPRLTDPLTIEVIGSEIIPAIAGF
jgi:hypothetical protein